MTKTRRISLLILSVLLSAVTVVSGFTVYRELSLQQKEKEDFAALAKHPVSGLPVRYGLHQPHDLWA